MEHNNEQNAQDEALSQSIENKKAEEEVVEQTEEIKKAGPDLDSKFAALSRKEKEIREMEKAFKEKYASFEEKFASLTKKEEEPEPEPQEPLEWRLKKDPINTLKEFGLDMDTLTNLLINDGQLTPEMKAELMKEELQNDYKSEIQKLREELLQEKKQKEEQEYNNTIAAFKSEIQEHVESSEELELTKAAGAFDQVYEVIRAHHEETGNVMSIEDASNYVEQYLEEEAEKLAKIEKIRKKLLPQDAPKPESKTPGVTLSNSQSSQVPNETKRFLSNEESLQKAAALLKWND